MTESKDPGSAEPEVEVSESAAPPTEAQPSEGWAPDRSRRKTIIFALVVVAGVLMALYAWGLGPFRSASVTTDNAYVRGQTTIISPQVNGYVTQVFVQDFAEVGEGEVLAKIDDRVYQQRVAQSDAAIETQVANLENTQQSERSGEAQVRLQDAAVTNARAQYARAKADMARVDDLVSQGSVSLRERDQTLAALRQSEAGIRQAKAQRTIATEQVRTVTVGRSGARALVASARAGSALARIDLDNTVIRAPSAGKLGEVAVRVGQLVQPGAQLMYLVPQRQWIVANFKEAQTGAIRVGQRATLKVDAFGGAELKGVVENIAPAAGSEFSVIKPDTGAGNFVKVPQRIAVRIRISPGQERAKRLGPGMSVMATVHTGSDR